MRGIVLVLRSIWIGLVLFGGLLSYGGRRVVRGRMTQHDKEHLRGQVLATTFERLGATFIKFGQILSTRPDLLGPGYIEPLSKLQDQVKPAPTKAIMGVLDGSLSAAARARLVSIEPEPVAAASVAQVHRAQLDTGETVALKIQRPNVARRITGDLTILGFWARVANVLPSVKPLSVPGAVAEFGVSLRGQLDFTQEADNNERFAEAFADTDGVEVPALYRELCTDKVLTMAFIDGVKGSEPDKVGGDRRRLALLGAKCILQMVFEDGFVHADLHPGNIILTDDGRVVMIDLGMVASIRSELMRPWLQTFTALGQQDGAEVARLLYVHAPDVAAKFDYFEYEAALCAHFARFHGKSMGEVEIADIVGGVMNILRRYRVRVDPSFTVVNISLLVAEGLGKQLDPSLDLVQLALPVLLKAGATAPPGIEPKRTIPTRPGLERDADRDNAAA